MPENRGFKYEKISAESEEYAEKRERLAYSSHRHYIFGADVLARISTLREARKVSAADIEEAEKKTAGILRASQAIFGAFFEEPATFSAAMDLLEEALQDEDFNNELEANKNITSHLPSEDLEKRAIELANVICDNVMPPRLYELLLAAHLKKSRERIGDLESKIPALSDFFRKRMPETFKEEGIEVPSGLLKRRMKESVVVFKDRLEVALANVAGQYFVERGEVVLAENVAEEDIKRNFAHEMLHALAGRTVAAEIWEKPRRSEKVVHHRGGLYFRENPFDAQAKNRGVRFRWLNEAVTEALTTRVVRESGKIYENERLLFVLLLTKGGRLLEPKLFFNAYFENYDPQHPQRVPAWKKLMNAVGEAYEPGFLLKLDKFIQKNGVEKAVKVFERDWREIA